MQYYSKFECKILQFQFSKFQNSFSQSSGELCTVNTSLSNMTLIDLSYKLGDKDRSIWPGNSPFVMKRVSEDDDNAMGCFIAHVSRLFV